MPSIAPPKFTALDKEIRKDGQKLIPVNTPRRNPLLVISDALGIEHFFSALWVLIVVRMRYKERRI